MPDAINPFDKDTAPGVQLVVSMRIYDALMALLQATDIELHDKLDAIHESGGLAWSLPFLDLKPDEPESEQSVPADTLSNTGHVPDSYVPSGAVVGETYKVGD